MSVALRYFNAAGADPTARSARITRPEIHLIPRAIEAASGGPALQVFGDDYPTPDGTCLRDYIHVTDLADAHVKALEAIAETRPSTAYNLGTGQPHSVREVIDAVERVTGAAVPWTLAPRRPGDPGRALRRAAQGAGRAGTGRRASGYRRRSSRTAWDWHRAIRTATGRQRIREPTLSRSRACSAMRGPIADGWCGRWWAMVVYAVGSAGLAALIKPIFDNVLPHREHLALVAWGDRRPLPAEGHRLVRARRT